MGWLPGTAIASVLLVQAAPAEAPVVAEARTFMEGYGRDLAAGDRAAVAARYSRAGAVALGLGPMEVRTYQQIVRDYAGPGWQPPASFAWRDLRFEPVGRDAVVVTGAFDWGVAGKSPVRLAYTALLRREEGRLRIRVEHENPLAPPR